MTISVQWLIFGGIGIGLFLFGLFARDGKSGESAKEEHMQSPTKALLKKNQQPEMEAQEKIDTAHASGRP